MPAVELRLSSADLKMAASHVQVPHVSEQTRSLSHVFAEADLLQRNVCIKMLSARRFRWIAHSSVKRVHSGQVAQPISRSTVASIDRKRVQQVRHLHWHRSDHGRAADASRPSAHVHTDSTSLCWRRPPIGHLAARLRSKFDTKWHSSAVRFQGHLLSWTHTEGFRSEPYDRSTMCQVQNQRTNIFTFGHAGRLFRSIHAIANRLSQCGRRLSRTSRLRPAGHCFRLIARLIDLESWNWRYCKNAIFSVSLD